MGLHKRKFNVNLAYVISNLVNTILKSRASKTTMKSKQITIKLVIFILGFLYGETCIITLIQVDTPISKEDICGWKVIQQRYLNELRQLWAHPDPIIANLIEKLLELSPGKSCLTILSNFQNVNLYNKELPMIERRHELILVRPGIDLNLPLKTPDLQNMSFPSEALVECPLSNFFLALVPFDTRNGQLGHTVMGTCA